VTNVFEHIWPAAIFVIVMVLGVPRVHALRIPHAAATVLGSAFLLGPPPSNFLPLWFILGGVTLVVECCVLGLSIKYRGEPPKARLR
jgi:heme/copper-type cytochrome/quinol oxidase subunit 2